MLEEALIFLRDQFVDAKGLTLLPIPGDHRKVLLSQNGTHSERAVPTPDRGHTVYSVGDLIDAAKRWDKAPVIWHDHAAVVLVCDDGDRFDRVTLPLAQAETFAAISKLASHCTFDQRALLRLLKFDLAGTLSVPLNLANNLRALKFRTSSSAAEDIQHGKESLGKAIEAEVSGADALPEQVTLATRVYSTFGEDEKWPIVCAFDIDVQEQKFRLKPLPGELEETIQRAQASIRQRIATALPDVAVFFGKP